MSDPDTPPPPPAEPKADEPGPVTEAVATTLIAGALLGVGIALSTKAGRRAAAKLIGKVFEQKDDPKKEDESK